jgi:hypothetical protein
MKKTKIAGILLIAAAPAWVSQGVVRTAAAVLCYGVALYLAFEARKAYRASMEGKFATELEQRVETFPAVIDPLTAHLNANVQITLVSRIR